MATSRLRGEDVPTMNSIRHYKGIFQIVSANTAIHSYFNSATEDTVFINEEKDVDDDVMPGITVEHILNSPFIEIDVEEEGDEDE